MELSSELEGIDFEWFATDAVGNLALFVTAGGGFVPQVAASASEAIASVSARIPTPHMGTGLLWGDYGAAGLYVYDWTWPEGPYSLIQQPTEAMAVELRQAIFGLPGLPKIHGDFLATTWVQLDDLVAA